MPTTTDAYARNPLADRHKAEGNSAVMAIAQRDSGRAAPTLFESGDLPRFTASGNPPSALLDLPWQLRHAAAAADQAEWARLFAEYGRGVDGADIMVAFEPAADHPGNVDYRNRFSMWLQGR